jgi:hypothetical protein
MLTGSALAVTAVVATLALPRTGSAAPARLEAGDHGRAVLELQQALVGLRLLPPGAATGRFGPETADAVIAFQGWEGLPRTGVAGAATEAALARSLPPTPWGGLRRGLEIVLSREVLLVVNDGAVSRAVHVSTGAEGHPTPRGHFTVYRSERMSWSVPYSVWMPYASYFDGGYAVHGFGTVPAYPASHGCVGVRLQDAPAIWSFATVGTPVWIR